jgi:hypothetical protein
MDKPELYKNIEVNGRKFKLTKMDARSSSYMLFKLMKIITPIFKNIKKDSLENTNIEDLNLTELFSSLFEMRQDEFEYVQETCLKAVYEILNAGEQQVIDKSGNWGVNDIEYDGALVMQLTIQSLIFNIKGFFSGNLLDSINKRLATFQQNSKM